MHQPIFSLCTAQPCVACRHRLPFAAAAAAAARPGGPPRSAQALLVLALAGRVHEDGVVLAARLGLGPGGVVVELLDKGGLDLAAALLPPLLLGGGLGVDLGEALAELGVAGDFVGGLEDGRAPVGREGVGLLLRVSMSSLTKETGSETAK